ncbi:MAG TPA: hypothetical protein VLU25_21250 [Acidobacteriota bacterium]|nr:hypothetical protein [Acidobacteriota bacterium]
MTSRSPQSGDTLTLALKPKSHPAGRVEALRERIETGLFVICCMRLANRLLDRAIRWTHPSSRLDAAGKPGS